MTDEGKDRPCGDVFSHEGAAVVGDVWGRTGGARKAKVAELSGAWRR